MLTMARLYYSCNLVMLLWLLFASIATANQIQFYDSSTRYGVAISTAILDNGPQVSIQIVAPLSYGWAALGSGVKMDGSMMMIIYPSTDGKSVTLSLRTGIQHHAPRPTDRMHANITSSNIKDGIMTANIVWQEDEPILCGVIDPVFHKQAWVWAVGSNQQIATQDRNFAITKHSENGVFFADMPQSQNLQVSPHAPALEGTNNVYIKPQPQYYTMLVYIHAILLGSAFVILFPLGIMGLRLNWMHRGFAVHWIFQLIGTVASYGGLGVAVTFSILGIKYNHFTDPHQILGITVSILLGLQVYLGRAHHVRFKLYKKRIWASYAHMTLGRLLMYGGMANACLGLLLCGYRFPAAGVGAVSLALAITVEFLAIRTRLRERKTLQRDQRIEGYNATYHKLKDVNVSEREVQPDWYQRSNSGYQYQSDQRFEGYRGPLRGQ